MKFPNCVNVLGILLCLLAYSLNVSGQEEFQAGAGIFDITGPAAEVNLVRRKYNLLLSYNIEYILQVLCIYHIDDNHMC